MNALRFFIIIAACIGAILTTIFSLTHGIFEVFPFLYILPIILSVYFYPKRAVLFSLGISILYISIVYALEFPNPAMIAISTAWFAIFITIAVVASSYANQLDEEQARIRQILNNSQDGTFCFDASNLQIFDINKKCARWLRYEPEELIGRNLSVIWPDQAERNRIISAMKGGKDGSENETLFRGKDGTILRFVISAVLVTQDRILCSVVDITGSKIVDEEIRKTLDDLEEQVRQRTEHLERINEELRAEILQRRGYQDTILPDGRQPQKDEKT